MRKFLILLLALSSPVFACKIPPETKLVIGCTYKCGLPNKFRLNLSAWALGYEIDVVDLRDLGPLEGALTKVDAVVIPGGANINPDNYSDKVTPEVADFKVTAYSNQGRIAEGIEYLNRPAIGVQYHPDKSLTSTAGPVFRWLLTRSYEYKTAKANS